MKKKYSFIIIVDDLSYLKKKKKFLKNFGNYEVVFIGNDDFEDNICASFNDSTYISLNQFDNLAKSLNTALSFVSGDFVNISYLSDYISNSIRDQIINVLQKKDIDLCLKSKKMPEVNTFEFSICDIIPYYLTKDFQYNELLLGCYFFKKNTYKNIKFDPAMKYMYETKFIIECLTKAKKYYVMKDSFCYYNRELYYHYFSDFNFENDWYLYNLKKEILPLLKEYKNKYVQNICFRLLCSKVFSNINALNKSSLNEEERDIFFDYFKKALKLIDDSIISGSSIKKVYKRMIFLLKYNKKTKKIVSNGNIKINKTIIDNAFLHRVEICAINKIDNKLVIDAVYNGKIFMENGAQIIVKLDNRKIECEPNNVYSSTLFLGRNVNDKYTFSFEIDIDSIKNNSILEFYFKYQKREKNLKMTFSSICPQSHLTKLFKHSYWVYDKNRIVTWNNNSIVFKRKNVFSLFLQELALYFDFLFHSSKFKLGVQALILRIIYRLTKPFYKNKRIWVTFDKLYKGGDNGEYLYQYCKTRKENINCYYIVNRDAYDYKSRLKKQKNVLKFKSLKEYLTVLNSECLFATHAKVFNFCSFTSGKEKYFRDLLNTEVFCLQHGLTIQDIAHIQNRIYDNTKLYFCASFNEILNLEKEKYDYKRFNYIKKTGLARYDGLKNCSKKEILITPTWRSNMANSKTVMGGTRPYYDKFKETDYYKIYNSLINNDKLINCAKENGYTITYLIHPTLTAQIDDFTKNDYVKIYSVTEDQSYEKLLTESSLMITDYSGVQFDFAYMRKPILYYHPEKLPPHYGTGGIDYEKEGFGMIVKTEEKLVDELCNYMKNDCKNKKEYIERANKFFIFNDYLNCERIYDETLEYMEAIK